jgi:hypothetical protein
MQTTYRLKAKEISAGFLKSVKTLFAGQEVEITIKSIPTSERLTEIQKNLLKMLEENRQNAPVISADVDIRSLIDESQYPSE